MTETPTGPDAAAPEGSAPTRREYQLTYEPDSRSWTARENLVDILERELLGPAHGEDELIEAQPDALYLVGRIAPSKLTGTGDVTTADAENPDTEAVNADDAHEGRGVPLPDVDDSAATSDEDAVEDQPQRRGMMIPASRGLRFQVPADLESVTIRASWGTYRPEDSGQVTKTGASIRHYRRTPVEHPVSVPVGALTPGETARFPLQADVLLQVDVMDQGGRRIVEVALCNDRVTPRRIPVDAWMYQTKLYVEAGGKEVFLPVTDVLEDERLDRTEEIQRLQLQYRDRLEFGVGRTCSADWAVRPDSRRASKVWTTWLPVAETPQTKARELDGVLLDMRALATASPDELRAGLQPIIDGYRTWLDGQATIAAALPPHLFDVAEGTIEDARSVANQLEKGLAFLLQDEEALRCFRFMNAVMADQRVQSQVAAERAKDPSLSLDAARERVLAQGPGAHRWRTFQLAFVLMQIEALARPEISRRSSDIAKVELLFFPTGGGKTEAYLGLAAFTFAIRRRQGVIEGTDGRIDCRSGVAVLMRYTLRLLTAQQFQRATALVCAAEIERRADEETWGTEPFRIGLWVGTAVSPKRYTEAAEQLASANEGRKYGLTVLQLQRCPWCGTPIDADDVHGDDGRRRIFVYCGDDVAACPFARGGQVAEGLPVLTVDEEIYRLAPAFVIATVDKFARLAREGEAAALFGYVRKRCERHGYVHDDYSACDIKDGSKHPAKGDLPAASVKPVDRLRPPDLIIQDELHLITGALGTAVGAFELTIDLLTTWKDAQGRTVRPLVVASTATVRNAADQIKGLYGRRVTMFPPQVLDVADTYFSTEVPVTRETPGRRYLGVCTTGVRLTTAEIRLASVLLSAGQLLLDRSGESADPYLTMVGYFNATRELAGMARFVADDIQTAVRSRRPGQYFPLRYGTALGSLHTAELTSRVASSDITGTLDQMAVTFSPDIDSTAARTASIQKTNAGEPQERRKVDPFDIVLATSMLQVGVDVSRLGLMLMVGQPKNTAEYIQASSRVGREADKPGLVVTLGNWARPRDLAHFEQFRHYHETFYAQVEPLSVTPFSITSIDRSLDGVLVSAVRVLDAIRPDGLSAERSAGLINEAYSRVEAIIDAVVARATVAGSEAAGAQVKSRLKNRLDQWTKRLAVTNQKHHTLVYERVTDGSAQSALLVSPESSRIDAGIVDHPPLVVANSMREVQPEINLLVSPVKEKLFTLEPDGAPIWELDTTNGPADD